MGGEGERHGEIICFTSLALYSYDIVVLYYFASNVAMTPTAKREVWQSCNMDCF